MLSVVIQEYLPQRSYKKGSVARPPPMANSPILKNLRKNTIPDECRDCEASETCHGGLKCLTYALYKNLNHKDVGCNV